MYFRIFFLVKGTNGRQKTYEIFHVYSIFYSGFMCQTTVIFVKTLKILYSLNHPILIKFRQLVVNIVIKELQMVFLTSTVINSNGNMKELERKIKCEKLMFR